MPRDDIINDVSALGGLPFFVVASATLVAATPALDRTKLGLMFALGLAACYGVTTLIRHLWFVPRPQPVEHAVWWQKLDASSFPSLHAMRAAFLATVLVTLFRSFVLAIPAVAIVLGVAWVRVHKKHHRTMDVVAGIIIGCILGILSLVLLAAFPLWFG